jgi:Asp-tRNA(Asn)/Glu-tRNA(Gln) amidotransferase A subunit family amidase
MATVAPTIPDGCDMPYRDGRMDTNFASLSNACHHTGGSYPCHLVDGLSVGLPVIGPARAEAVVLGVWRTLEQVAPNDVQRS